MYTKKLKGHTLHISEILPSQVASIDTLVGKSLHITLDSDTIKTIGEFIVLYGKLVDKYIKQNDIKTLSIKVQQTKATFSDSKTIVILNKLD